MLATNGVVHIASGTSPGNSGPYTADQYPFVLDSSLSDQCIKYYGLNRVQERRIMAPRGTPRD